MALQARNLDTDAQRVGFDHGHVDVVTIAGTAFARASFAPGWCWSVDAKPLVGTDTCQVPHTGVVLSGRFHARMDDGTEVELGPGDAHVVPPGHDAWVVGDEPCLIIDIGTAPDDPGGAPQDVVRGYFEAFSAGDVERVLAGYAEDAVVCADGIPTLSGRAALEPVYKSIFTGMSFSMTPEIDSVTRTGDLAVVRTHSTGTMTTLETGASVPGAGRELFVLRRDEDGWRIAEYLFNQTPAQE